MSLSRRHWAKLAAYSDPFSGTGMEFLPLGVTPDLPSLTLHETGFIKRRPFWNYPHTFSPFWRLYYDLEPGHVCAFPHQEVALGPDKIVLIPDNCLFHSRGTAAKPKFWLHFTYGLRPSSDQPLPIQLEPSKPELALIESLVALLAHKLPEQKRKTIQGLSLALLHTVLTRQEIVWSAEPPGSLARTPRYIERHLEAPLYNSELASQAGMSVGGFVRAFRRHYHVSPAVFIAQVRVRAASHLLSGTDLSLEDIAEKCGFPNRDYFSRVFKRLVGDAPAAFRRQHKTANRTNQAQLQEAETA